MNAHASIHDSPLQLGKKNWVTFYKITRKTFEKSEILFVNNLEDLREKSTMLFVK